MCLFIGGMYMIFNLLKSAKDIYLQDGTTVENSIKTIRSGRAFIETGVSTTEKFIAYPSGFTSDNAYVTGVINYTTYGTWVDQTYGGAVYATNVTLTANNIRLQGTSANVTKVRLVLQKYV